jgi:amino acid transporter
LRRPVRLFVRLGVDSHHAACLGWLTFSSFFFKLKILAAIGAISFAQYLCEVFYEPGCVPPLLKKLIGISLILFLGIVNARSLRLSSAVFNPFFVKLKVKRSFASNNLKFLLLTQSFASLF